MRLCAKPLLKMKPDAMCFLINAHFHSLTRAHDVIIVDDIVHSCSLVMSCYVHPPLCGHHCFPRWLVLLPWLLLCGIRNQEALDPIARFHLGKAPFLSFCCLSPHHHQRIIMYARQFMPPPLLIYICVCEGWIGLCRWVDQLNPWGSFTPHCT